MIAFADGSISASCSLKLPPLASQAASLRSGCPLGSLGIGPLGGPARRSWVIVWPDSCVKADSVTSGTLTKVMIDTTSSFLTICSPPQRCRNLAVVQHRSAVGARNRVLGRGLAIVPQDALFARARV